MTLPGDRAPLRGRPPAAAGGRHLRPGVRRPRRARPSTRSRRRRRGHAADRRRHADRHPATLWRWVLAALVAAIVVGLVVLVAVRPPPAPPPATPRSTRPTPTCRWSCAACARTYGDGFVAVANVDFTVAPRSGGRPARPQRRRQDHHAAGADGADPADAGRDLRLRPPAGARLAGAVPARRAGRGARASCRTCPGGRTSSCTGGRPAGRWRRRALRRGAGDRRPRRRDRPRVKTYSHGMRQRLAIAQAMLGLPELLVLDEPTDGLDPPQIAEMRRVLQRYATDGRAVLVSSHLLAEVEQTCTHVVVMHKGEIVAAGPVDEIVGDSPTVQFDVDDPVAARAVLDKLDGVRLVPEAGGGAGRRHRRRAAPRGRRRAGARRDRRGPGGAATAAGGRVPRPGRRRHSREAGTDDDQSLPSPTGAGAAGYRPAAHAAAVGGVAPAGVPAAYPADARLHGPAAADRAGRFPVRHRRRPGRRGRSEFSSLVDARHRRRAELRALHSLRLRLVPAGRRGRALLRRHRGQRGELGEPAVPARRPGAAGPAAGGEADGGARLFARWRCCCWSAPRCWPARCATAGSRCSSTVAAELPAGEGLLRLLAILGYLRWRCWPSPGWRSCCRC